LIDQCIGKSSLIEIYKEEKVALEYQLTAIIANEYLELDTDGAAFE
jgi:hypothetical protein